jgi:hypothetical protein
VYEGSIVVIYDLIPNDDQTMEDLQTAQAAAFSSDIDLGFNVLDVAS